MKNVWKKPISLWLASLMIFSSVLPAFATNEDEAQADEAVVAEEALAENGEVAAEDKEVDMSLLESMVPDNTTIPESFEFIGETDTLALYAETDASTGNLGEFAVVKKATGFVWRSNPIQRQYDTVALGDSQTELASQLIITYYREYNSFRTNMYKQSVSTMGKGFYENGGSAEKPGRATLELLPEGVGFKMTYTVYTSGIGEFVIPVSYEISGDKLIAKILTTDPEARFSYTVRELASVSTGVAQANILKDVDYNIAEIELLPFFGAGGVNEAGYCFIPDGSGALIDFNNGKTIFEPYTAPIYGAYADTTGTYSKLSDNVCLPVFGIMKENGANPEAFVAIVSENAGAGFIEAAVAGRDTAFNTVYSQLQNKIIESNMGKSKTQPVSPVIPSKNEDYAVEYCFLSGDDANYVGMANRYRKYLTEEKEGDKMVAAENATESKLYIDAYAGVQRETSIAGVPVKIFDAMTTYEDLKTMALDFKSEGIEKMTVKYSDWMKSKKRLKVASKVSFEKKLGGKKAFGETVSFMENEGIGFYPNVDFLNYAKGGHGYTGFFDSAKSADQSPAFQRQKDNSHIYLGERWYLLKPNLVVQAAGEYLNAYKKTGSQNISLESIGSRIYSDSSSDGISRGESVNSWISVMQMYKQDGGKIMLSNSNAYALPYADEIINIPTQTTYVELADRGVPFYQLVLRGYLPYSTESINLSSDIETEVLKAAEIGSNLCFSFVYGDPSNLKETYLNYLYSCDYSTWRERIVEIYNEHKALQDRIEGAAITSHRYINNKLVETVYDNGVTVYVNYDTEAQMLPGGASIDASSYVVVEGGAQ